MDKQETFKQMLNRIIRNSESTYNLTGEISDLNMLNDLRELRATYNKENSQKGRK